MIEKMKSLHLVFGLICVFVSAYYTTPVQGNRTFVIDWNKDRFLKDGEPFRFIAGSFHYFRAHPETWQRKLRIMRAAGLNAVTTYVEWSLHNPRDGVYVWKGIADLERFIKLAVEEDLLVILRPGPYICAERDMGGFPYWLLTKHDDLRLRTDDTSFTALDKNRYSLSFLTEYLGEVRKWYGELMPRITPYLYGNGGPIIMVQVENEYGSYYACDKSYRAWLRDETLSHVKDNAVLFTNDGPSMLRCGQIDGVLATMDFGATNDLQNTWNMLRRVQPKGPLVNAEYYPGWLTHWSESRARVPTRDIVHTFTDMLDDGASVNFYMFYGGTNFGFTAGANDGGPGRFQPDITSYDYDAPMNEAGDPTTKYYAIREIIKKYLPIPDIPMPKPVFKKKYGQLQLRVCCTLLSRAGRALLSTGTEFNLKPKTFEKLDQYSGLVLYETDLPRSKRDPSVLRASGIHDRAYVYVDEQFVGVLSRETPIYDLPISANAGNRLQMLVENQGRINYGLMHDTKGIISDVMFNKKPLLNWNMTKFPLESYEDLENLIEESTGSEDILLHYQLKQSTLSGGPTVFHGEFNITKEIGLGDTYLDTSGWGKGVLFINGENLGRYWPVAGPQVTLYVPQEVLRIGVNKVILIEYQHAPPNLQVFLTDTPNLDGLE